MFRFIVVLFLLIASTGSNQLFAAAADTIPCDPTVKMSRTFCPSCEAWGNEFAPDFTGKIPVEFQISVFNKDSVVVFTSADINKGWNGTGKDNFEQTQRFTWEMNYRYEKNGTLYRCRGELVLIQ